MVYAGFRDARRDIPDPPPAQSAPDPHDEENMDARPDQEEMEQAINKFLQQLEKQEKKGFKDSWQVTRQKHVNFCQKLEYESHTNMTNMQKYAPPHFADGALVPRCCKWAWV